MGPAIAYFGTVTPGQETEASARAHVVEQILDRVLPGWRSDPPKNDEDYDWLRHQAPRAKAALQRQSELAQKLGDNAPDMDAANLHPWRGRTAGPAKSSLVALHRRLLPKRSSTTLGGGAWLLGYRSTKSDPCRESRSVIPTRPVGCDRAPDSRVAEQGSAAPPCDVWLRPGVPLCFRAQVRARPHRLRLPRGRLASRSSRGVVSVALAHLDNRPGTDRSPHGAFHRPQTWPELTCAVEAATALATHCRSGCWLTASMWLTFRPTWLPGAVVRHRHNRKTGGPWRASPVFPNAKSSFGSSKPLRIAHLEPSTGSLPLLVWVARAA